ncbi:uncharacterized protein LOC131881173 [Tigriopus californicus]|uniref:uncharacterized protein LOC131881173 n=1 Tax=Tigriopus californicus TaxID=6832 RepID=UPI0027DA62B6|nr:uncharacterized protein LOC131881173 [Tigriopus californicus]
MRTVRKLSNARRFQNGVPALTAAFYHANFSMFFQEHMNVYFVSGYPEGDLLYYMSALLLDCPIETTQFLAEEFEDFLAKAIMPLGSTTEFVWSGQGSVHEKLLEHLKNRCRAKQRSIDACSKGADICGDPLNKVGARLIALAIFRCGQYPYTNFGQFLEHYFETVFQMPLFWGQRKDITELYLEGNLRRKSDRLPQSGYSDLTPHLSNLEETIVSNFLIEASTRFFKNMEHLNISLYEISQVVDLPYHAGEAHLYQAKEIYRKMNCYNYDYLRKYNTSKCGPDEHPKIAGCCRIWEAISTQHEGILSMMRFNQQAPHWNSEDDVIFDEAKKGYFGNFEDIVKPYGINNPRIFGCQWLGQPREEKIFSCNLFHRLFTNAGMGYTCNSADYEDLFLDTSYLNMFKKIMNSKGKSHEKPILSVDRPGPQNTLKIHIELSQQFDNFIKFGHPLYSWSGGIPESSFRSLDKSFKIGIHHPGSLADLRNDYIKVKPGFEYQVLITPQVHTAEESLRSMSLEKRKCQFQDESSDSLLFKSYSQTNCQLECRLKFAVEQCDCLPWNYPHMVLDGQLTKLCDYRGNYCVENILHRSITWQECPCYPPCETITYTFSMNIKTMERPCSSEFGSAFPIQYVQNSELAPFISYPVDDYLTGKNRSLRALTVGKEEFCHERCDNSAVVEFQLVGTSVTVVKKSARITFIGALANLGGLIALFTGMSVLSLFEMLFWMWKCFRAKYFCSLGNKQK